MLDVHAPHESVHTWRDFFIHIATIVVGLIIAVGLEQAVEAVHHRHQRQQLMADLHHEALVNKTICEHDVAFFDEDLRWLLDVKAYVDAYRTGHGKQAGQFPMASPEADVESAGNVGDADPETAVWTTARESGLVDLLPREQAASLSVTYGAAALEMEEDKVMLKGLDHWTGMLAGDRQQAYKMDAAGKSDSQLEALSAALGEEIAAVNAERRYLLLFYGENNAVLDGTTSREQFRAEIARAYRRFPNRYELPFEQRTASPAQRNSPGPTSER